MNVSGLFFERIFAPTEVSATATQRIQQTSTEGSNRNLGPDTVTLSPESQEKYHAMKASNEQVESVKNDVNSGNILSEISTSATTSSNSPSEKLDDGAFLAFLKSENFSKNAMSYVKTVAVETKGEEDDDTISQVVKNLGQTESQRATPSTTLTNADSAKHEQNENGLGNSEESSEEELAASIAKAKRELEDLTISYEEIMSGEGILEEKIQLAQPVYKQLKEKADQVMSLESQAKMQNIQKEKGQLDNI